jgi:hypothetical protein
MRSVNLTAAPIAPKFSRGQRTYKENGTRKNLIGFRLFFNGPLNVGIARSTAHYVVS